MGTHHYILNLQVYNSSSPVCNTIYLNKEPFVLLCNVWVVCVREIVFDSLSQREAPIRAMNECRLDTETAEVSVCRHEYHEVGIVCIVPHCKEDHAQNNF